MLVRPLLLIALLTGAACPALVGYEEPSLGSGPGVQRDSGTGPVFPPDAGTDPGSRDAQVPMGPPDAGFCAPAPAFGSPTNYGAGTNPQMLAVGDVDNDLRPDVVVAGGSATISIWHGSGNPIGPLEDSQSVNLGSGCFGVDSLLVADLDGNDLNDLVIVSRGQSCEGLYLIRQNPSSPGQFLGAQLIGASPGGGQLGAGDLNNDGRTDLVVVTPEGLTRYYQKAASPGTFTAQTVLAVGQIQSKNPMVVADLNGDGLDDIALAADQRVQVLFQQGAGNFSAAQGVGPSDTRGFAAGDVNGDSFDDLVIANSTGLAVFTQKPAQPGSFTIGQTFSFSAGDAIGAVDLNADDRLDLVLRQEYYLQCAAPSPAGQFSTDFAMLPGQASAWIDLDDDGRVDMLSLDGSQLSVRKQDLH